MSRSCICWSFLTFRVRIKESLQEELVFTRSCFSHEPFSLSRRPSLPSTQYFLTSSNVSAVFVTLAFVIRAFTMRPHWKSNRYIILWNFNRLYRIPETKQHVLQSTFNNTNNESKPKQNQAPDGLTHISKLWFYVARSFQNFVKTLYIYHCNVQFAPYFSLSIDVSHCLWICR